MNTQPSAEPTGPTAHPAPGPGDWLLLDAAFPRAAIGVWREGGWASFLLSDGPGAELLFSLTERALAQAGVSLPELSGYLFAEGPGSVLGLRTAAMALRTWSATPTLTPKPILAYSSLLLARRLAGTETKQKVTVFAASRRDRWNALGPDDATWSECDAEQLAAFPEPRLRLPSRDVSGQAPGAPFDPQSALGAHPEVFLEAGLLSLTTTPDAANLANLYATWSGERHKA